ncbi:hypothetical protein DIURU_000850 [Diutina rugosa]|uniref:Cell division control protein 25 n=1 Tax=Diutina rugosa TaxID=5481 RepID=A0A642UX84_DIURU|nr:uncharacterized protein DIURU_000850 [Diutina rugosa]KAA8907166.1 hypothetical protein DIURU_000850 [Diutina rugosa]
MSYPDEIPPDFVTPHDGTHPGDEPLRPLDTVIALYDFAATQPSHLPLRLGDTVYILAKAANGWWDGVVIGASGDLQRGWIPHNYVRSVNYVQPVLNKLKSNKELDSITAANTAANVLIPSFTSLLQKNLADYSERSTSQDTTRKNSVVSFASEDTQSSHETSQKQSQAPPPSGATTHNPSVATTITLGSDEQPSQVESPSVGDPAPEERSPSPVYVSETEAERLADDYVAEWGRGVTWIPRCTIGGDFSFFSPQLEVYCEVVPMTNFTASNLTIPAPIEAPSFESLKNSSKMVDADAEMPRQPSKLSTAPTFDSGGSVFKRDSNASSSISQGSQSLYHHFTQSFFYLDDLFYPQSGDLQQWDQVPPAMDQILEYTSIAVRDQNKPLFTTHMDRVQRIIALCILASRLTQDDFNGTRFEKSVRRRLKRLTASFSQLYINGLLYLSLTHYSGSLNEAGPVLQNDIRHLNKQSPSNQVSVSSSGIDSVGPPSSENSMASKSDAAYLAQFEKEVVELKHIIRGIVRIFNKVTEGKRVYRRHYDSSDTEAESDDDMTGADRSGRLPQVYPRFFTDEFNGGNWCNPFFMSQNPVLNVSGDDLKNRYHSKIVIDQQMYDQVVGISDKMRELSQSTLAFLTPERQQEFYNDTLKQERNTQILRLVYKYLFHASSLIDVIESLDFTVFCLVKKATPGESDDSHIPGYDGDNDDDGDDEIRKRPPSSRRQSRKEPEIDASEFQSNLAFDYPIVLEFFQLKQKFHDLIMSVIMGTQALTLEDPDVFKGLREEDQLIYDKDQMKDPQEKSAAVLAHILLEHANHHRDGAISTNPDVVLSEHLSDSMKFLNSIQKILQQLIEERETILNYATRVLHDDLNVQLLVIERNNTLMSEKSGPSHSNSSVAAVTSGVGGDITSNIAAAAMKKSARGSSNSSADAPWFLEGDEEFDLILDIKGNVKGGTKEALVAHLTHHDLFDSAFNAAFLLTFPTMLSLGELLALLINRFHMDAPDGLSFEEYNLWSTKKRNPMRLRVMNIMKLIVEKHWTDSYYNESVLRRWLVFAQSKPVQQFSIGKQLAVDLTKLLAGERVCFDRVPMILPGKAPNPITKGSIHVKRAKLTDIDYMELARQLTIREFAMYSRISKFACLAKVWGKKSGLSESYDEITAFIKASNQLTNFVAYSILRKSDPRKRVHIIRYWVQVAEKCRQYNNFSSMTAIISALYSSPIHRLKKTWKFLSGETSNHLHNMNKLMNSSRNFNEYRDVLKFIGSEPCVPFFGVYLSDLTFVYHGNPDNLMNRSRLINFAKRAKTCEILGGIDRFKTTGYNFQTVKEIQMFLDVWYEKCPTIAEQYQISLQLEPREGSLADENKSRKSKGHGIAPNFERMILRS